MMSLLDTLQRFVDKNQVLEKLSPDGENGFAREFLQIQIDSRAWVGDATHQTTDAQLKDNMWKNRFKDILPFDTNRVKLRAISNEPCHDYINASFIKGINGSYIAAQGPTMSTVADFWRMILEYKILVVVMVCNVREAGKIKCERYWPYEDEAKRFNDMVVALEAEDRLSSEFTRRRLCVKCDNGRTHSLVQYHYTSWPDHGTPSNYTTILEMLACIWDHDNSEKRRLLVHCSAGCGRTGTICAIDYAWNVLRERPEEISPFLVRDIVLNLRRQRVAMVQTKEQYEFTYRVVADLFSKHRDMTLLHDYVNVDRRGEMKMEDDFVDLYESIYSLSVVPLASNLQKTSVEPIYFNAIKQTLNRYLPDKKINLDSVEKLYTSAKKSRGEKPILPDRLSVRKRPEVSQNDKPEWDSVKPKPKGPAETGCCKTPESLELFSQASKLPPKIAIAQIKDDPIYTLPNKKRAGSSFSTQSENTSHVLNQPVDVLHVDSAEPERIDDAGPYAMCDFGTEDSTDPDSDMENAYSYVSASEVDTAKTVCERSQSPICITPRSQPIPVSLSERVNSTGDLVGVGACQNAFVVDDSYEYYTTETRASGLRSEAGKVSAAALRLSKSPDKLMLNSRNHTGVGCCRSYSVAPLSLPGKSRSQSCDSQGSTFYRSLQSFPINDLPSMNEAPETTLLNDVITDPRSSRLSAYRRTASAPDLMEDAINDSRLGSDVSSKRAMVYVRKRSYANEEDRESAPLIRKFQAMLPSKISRPTHISAPLWPELPNAGRGSFLMPTEIVHPEIEAALRRENIKRPKPAQLISLSMAKDSLLVKDQVQFSSVNEEEDRTSEQSSDGSAPANVFTRWKSKLQAGTRDMLERLDSVNMRAVKPSASFHEGLQVNSWYKPSPVPCMVKDGVRTDFPNKYSRKPKGPRPRP